MLPSKTILTSFGFGALLMLACSSGGSTGVGDGGTSGGSVMHVDDYNQSCSVNEDCVVVRAGDACAECACQRSAISKSEQARFQTEQRQKREGCPPSTADCKVCAEFVAECIAGQCKARQCLNGFCANE